MVQMPSTPRSTPNVQDRDLGFIREFTLIEVIENRIGWFTCKATLNPR